MREHQELLSRIHSAPVRPARKNRRRTANLLQKTFALAAALISLLILVRLFF